MSDLQTMFDGETFASDLIADATDLATDEGLATAVVISLFTDARARPDDVLPDEMRSLGDPAPTGRPGSAGALTRDARGWWGDMVPPPQASDDGARHRTGSRLWLLSREKQTQEVLRRAEEYARESLQWLIEDGVARAVGVQAFIPQTGWLGLIVTVDRVAGRQRFEHVWSAHAV